MRRIESLIAEISVLFLIFVFLFVFGCTLARLEVEVQSERTTLENQVLGTYNSLDRDMLLASSVRGVDPEGRIRKTPSHSREHKDALTAMRLLAFHDDDLFAFKRLGWVGENNRGLLTPFELSRQNPPEDLKDFAGQYTKDEFDSVVSRINEARETIMRRVIYMNENLSEKDLPQIRRVFARLNAENALPNEKIQKEDGNWTVAGKPD